MFHILPSQLPRKTLNFPVKMPLKDWWHHYTLCFQTNAEKRVIHRKTLTIFDALVHLQYPIQSHQCKPVSIFFLFVLKTNKPQATYLLRHPSSAFYPCSTSVLFSVSSVRDLDRPRRCSFSVVYLGNQKEHSNQTERVNEEEIGRIKINWVLIIDDQKKKKTESDPFVSLTFNKTVSHITFLITHRASVAFLSVSSTKRVSVYLSSAFSSVFLRNFLSCKIAIKRRI